MNPISVSAARPAGSVAGEETDETDSDETASEATAAAVAAVNAAVTGTSIVSIGPASFVSDRADDDREAAPCGVRAMRAAAAAAADAAGVEPGLE